MRKKFYVVLALFLLFSVAAAQEVRVGTLLPKSGTLKEYGPHCEKAVLLAAKQIRAAGLNFKVIPMDSATAVDPAVNAAKKLVNIDRVLALIGPMASELTIPVAKQVTIPKGVVLITPGSTSPVLSNLPADVGKDLVFRTCPSDALQGPVAAQLAAVKYKKASILYVDNAYGAKLAEQFKKAFERKGGQVAKMVPIAAKASVSYKNELAAALSVKPQIICAYSYPEHAKIYVKQACDIHNFRNFLYCDGTKSLDIAKAVGPSNVEGMFGTAPISAKGRARDMFEAAYKAEYRKLMPYPFIANAYDAAAVLGLAAYAAMQEKKALTPANIRDMLRKVSSPPGEPIYPGEFPKAFRLLRAMKPVNYMAAAGWVDFDTNGDVVTPIEIWQYKNGSIVSTGVKENIR
jgi:ABC-type branched-subunit amino acid transport system substrate-binding protein